MVGLGAKGFLNRKQFDIAKRPGETPDVPPPRRKDVPTQQPGQPIPQPGDAPVGIPPTADPRNPGPPL